MEFRYYCYVTKFNDVDLLKTSILCFMSDSRKEFRIVMNRYYRIRLNSVKRSCQINEEDYLSSG